jgi:hypothetical protein
VRCLWIGLVGFSAASPAAAGTWDRVQAARDDAGAVDEALARRATLHDLTAELLVAAPTGHLPETWPGRARAAGLAVDVDEPGVVVVHGDPGRADGLIAVRLGPGVSELVLMAPHGWHDADTGRIVGAWFDAGYARVALFNTAHRYGGPGEPRPRSDADVAHRAETAFQAMFLGAVDGLPDPLVVQIHGFGEDHGPVAAVVADGGALQPPGVVLGGVAALTPWLGRFGSVVTGAEVPALAATENVQGRAISGRRRFLHVELSREARRALVDDDALRAGVAAALIDEVVGP